MHRTSGSSNLDAPAVPGIHQGWLKFNELSFVEAMLSPQTWSRVTRASILAEDWMHRMNQAKGPSSMLPFWPSLGAAAPMSGSTSKTTAWGLPFLGPLVAIMSIEL